MPPSFISCAGFSLDATKRRFRSISSPALSHHHSDQTQQNIAQHVKPKPEAFPSPPPITIPFNRPLSSLEAAVTFCWHPSQQIGTVRYGPTNKARLLK